MYIIILEPNSNQPQILCNDNGIAYYNNERAAQQDAENAQYNKMCEQWIIVQIVDKNF